MLNTIKTKSFIYVLIVCSSCLAQENLSSKENELLNIVFTTYKLNMQAIDSFEIKYEMERMHPTTPQTKIESLNSNNSKIISKKGTLGFEGNKLYNIEIGHENRPMKFVQNGTNTRIRPVGTENYVAQSGTPGRLKPFTVTPWKVFDGGFTDDLVEQKVFKIISVEKVAHEGESCIKITGTRNANVENDKSSHVRAEVYYSPSIDYMPVYLETYIRDKPFGKASVTEYKKIEKNGNVVYVPVSIEGFIKKPNGELYATRKYYVDTDSIRLNEGISDEKFEIKTTKEDTLYDLDLNMTLYATEGTISFSDEMAFEAFQKNNNMGRLVDDNTGSEASKVTKEVSIDLNNNIKIKLIYISSGEFVMGSPDKEIGYGNLHKKHFKRNRPKDESPMHPIEIKNGFYMGIYEVTGSEYKCFKSDYHRRSSYGKVMDKDDQPAIVNWLEAKSFCDWLSKKSGLTVRLPSEAEWEYVCRAGSTTRFFWGNKETLACKFANILDESALNAWPDRRKMNEGSLFNCNDNFVVTAPVGSFMPNAFGLYDMIGNIPEWCEDLYTKYDNQESKSISTIDHKEIHRVIRGGGYESSFYKARSAARLCDVPNTKYGHYGFRIVVEQNKNLKK